MAPPKRDSDRIYWLLALLLIVYSALAVLAPLITPTCTLPPDEFKYKNVDFQPNPCRNQRYIILGGMTPWECDMCTRILASLVTGTIIGWERRRGDRPAGIRTMAIISLGSCSFTVASIFSFITGPQSWDPARVAAAIPSGIGFLGAASIWKKTKDIYEVHGLTTATSVWLAAGVGIMVGGAQYVTAITTTFAAIVYLRFGPRTSLTKSLVEPSEALRCV
eukprot:scaffold315173_cov36-Tisochrysis_lutea.AAC.1